MKFIVRRASERGSDFPCEESKRDNIVRVDKRCFHSPEEFDERLARSEGKWFSVGENHRIDKSGYIARDIGMTNVFSMEINTLDELIKFCDKYGDVVISDCYFNNDYKEILIYDDYIE